MEERLRKDPHSSSEQSESDRNDSVRRRSILEDLRRSGESEKEERRLRGFASCCISSEERGVERKGETRRGKDKEKGETETKAVPRSAEQGAAAFDCPKPQTRFHFDHGSIRRHRHVSTPQRSPANRSQRRSPEDEPCSCGLWNDCHR